MIHDKVHFDIEVERIRQEKLKAEGKFLFTCADKIEDPIRLAILAEEFGEVAKEVTEGIIFYDKVLQGKNKQTRNEFETANRKKIRTELIQVAAVCVAWAEALDREIEDG